MLPSAALSAIQSKGAFWDERDYQAYDDWVKGRSSAPRWAHDSGTDDQGTWADVELKGVTQRMRWIWPGEFLMGSPEDEPERSADERQHPVLLTRGFWLADTACTQALWQAVMANNPSGFQGPERPVENLSWEDVQQFIARLNRALPGLEARLPTEAEWEYACRAGTRTPFAFGPTVDPEQVNYHGDYPYAGGKPGRNRGETVEVKALAANAWGLYQMHGNVWEWCQDWYGDYPEGRVLDPSGPAAGVERVLRGGGWVFHARVCRSARRHLRLPGYRGVFRGFRLARGPTGKPAEPGQQESEQGRAGRTERSGVGQALRGAWRRLRGG